MIDRTSAFSVREQKQRLRRRMRLCRRCNTPIRRQKYRVSRWFFLAAVKEIRKDARGRRSGKWRFANAIRPPSSYLRCAAWENSESYFIGSLDRLLSTDKVASCLVWRTNTLVRDEKSKWKSDIGEKEIDRNVELHVREIVTALEIISSIPPK